MLWKGNALSEWGWIILGWCVYFLAVFAVLALSVCELAIERCLPIVTMLTVEKALPIKFRKNGFTEKRSLRFSWRILLFV